MSDSTASHSTSKSSSDPAGFPFADSPAIPGGAETIVNPERRSGSSVEEGGIRKTDSRIHRLLFPDFSEIQVGELPESPAGVRLAHFEIVDRIGSGGMGSVFLALDMHLQRYVALKVLSPSQSREPSAVQRFLNEARAAARLDFDGIARVHFYGEDKGFHFIAFEYVTGTNIRDMIQARGALNPSDAVNFTLQVAHALKYTMAAGVVHRDIKPSNVIVNPAGRAKLVDLGLARKESSESMEDLTVAGTTLGTFDYISPEQAQDPRNVDVRSDIYSLGCTLYHMLTGEPPYPQGTLAQKLLEHQQSYVPDPGKLNRKVPPQLSDVVRKMMASDPRKRYQSPEALIRDLLQIAQQLGLKGTTPEGLVWTASQQPRMSRLLNEYASWLTAGAMLLIIVFAIDRLGRNDSNGRPANEPERVAQAPNSPGSQQVETGGDRQPSAASGGISPTNAITPDSGSDSSSGTMAKEFTGDRGAPTTDVPDLEKDFFNQNSGDNDFPRSIVDDASRNTSPAIPSGVGELTGNTPSIPSPAQTVNPAAVETVESQEPPLRPTTEVQTGKPILLTQPGEVTGIAFDTLEAACSEARDNSLIELRYDGRRAGDFEKPIAVNRRIRIRAAAGYRPQVTFASRRNPEESDLRMISLQGGSLEVSGVEFVLTVSDAPAPGDQNHWALFSLSAAEQLKLQKVTATIVNPDGYSAALIEFNPGSGAAFEKMKRDMGVGAPNPASGSAAEVTVLESVLRGQSHAILVRSSRPGQVAVTRSMVAVQNAFCRNLGSAEMPSDGSTFNLTVDHLSCVTGTSVLSCDTGEIREILPLSVTARNSYFVQNPIESAPLVSMTGFKDAIDFRGDLVWNGEKNDYDGFRQFWTISNPAGTTETDVFDFSEWVEFWEDSFDGGESRTSVERLSWASDWTSTPFPRLRPADLTFSDTLLMSEAIKATDLTNIGAPLEELPSADEPQPSPAE